MSVRVLAFFDTRYQSTPDVAAFWKTADPWQKLREARPMSRQHGLPNWPSTLGPYDLSQFEQAAGVVGMAAKIGIDGFIVDCIAHEDRYLTGAESIASLTGPSFGLAFRWDCAGDPAWRAPAERESRSARARALVSALKVGTHSLADGRTILVIDHPEMLAEPSQAIEILREEANSAGLPGLYLIATQAETKDSRNLGFDAVLDPGPAQWAATCAPQNKLSGFKQLEVLVGWRDMTELRDTVYEYTPFVISRMRERDRRGVVLPRVFPAYQDWALHPDGGAVLLLPGGGTPGGGLQRHFYGLFLENALLYAHDRFPPSEGLVFLQSWNGWCENSQIEPSALDGDIVYEATRDAIAKGRFMMSAKGRKQASRLSPATRSMIVDACNAALRG